MELIAKIEPHMKIIVKCDGISKKAKILCALRFFATGKYYYLLKLV